MHIKPQPFSIITRLEPTSMISEAFRTIRTSISYSALDNHHNVILVTSAVPAEGKTSIVSNLGILTAQNGKRTLLIDGDLRSPHLHHIFGTTNRSGLSTMLMNYADPLEAIQRTDVPFLSIMTAGPIQTQPTELIASSGLERLMNLLRNSYDVIFIDTPPILTVTDAIVMARVTDGIVLVVRSMLTRRDQFIRAQKKLEPFHHKMLGIVMNDKKEN